MGAPGRKPTDVLDRPFQIWQGAPQAARSAPDEEGSDRAAAAARPMPRTREFDEDEVIERATRVFWDLGYDGTTVPDLLQATGLSRSSLYETFGDKRALFLRTVHAYVREAQTRRHDSFSGGTSFREGLGAYLRSRLDARRQGRPPGCYLTSISGSLKTADEELRGVVQAVNRDAEREIRSAFEQALAAGAVSRRLDAAAWARLFLVLFWGLNVAARTGRSREEQAQMIDAFLELLKEE